MPCASFRFNDPVGEAIKIILRTVRDGANHTLQYVSIHIIPAFLRQTASTHVYYCLISTNSSLTKRRFFLGLWARTYRHPSPFRSDRMSWPRSRSAVTARETVGMEMPNSTAIIGVE